MKLKVIEGLIIKAGNKLKVSYKNYKPAKLGRAGQERVFTERNLTLYLGAELIKNQFAVFAEHYFFKNPKIISPNRGNLGLLDMLALKDNTQIRIEAKRLVSTKAAGSVLKDVPKIKKYFNLNPQLNSTSKKYSSKIGLILAICNSKTITEWWSNLAKTSYSKVPGNKKVWDRLKKEIIESKPKLIIGTYNLAPKEKKPPTILYAIFKIRQK